MADYAHIYGEIKQLEQTLNAENPLLLQVQQLQPPRETPIDPNTPLIVQIGM